MSEGEIGRHQHSKEGDFRKLSVNKRVGGGGIRILQSLIGGWVR